MKTNDYSKNSAICRIIASCNPRFAKRHYHGEEVLQRDGTIPVRWVHDDNFGHLYTREEAHEKLIGYARKYYLGGNDAQEFKSIQDAKDYYREIGDPESEWDFSWYEGPGFYENEIPDWLYSEVEHKEGAMTWSIEEV
ncbi:MAG: hypothetical protein LKM37_04160 [Bacteroidales bacterium]|jgi:hypothetical protein|nr:hypothetical protein [Bacteroidales bacterium]